MLDLIGFAGRRPVGQLGSPLIVEGKEFGIRLLVLLLQIVSPLREPLL